MKKAIYTRILAANSLIYEYLIVRILDMGNKVKYADSRKSRDFILIEHMIERIVVRSC